MLLSVKKSEICCQMDCRNGYIGIFSIYMLIHLLLLYFGFLVSHLLWHGILERREFVWDKTFTPFDEFTKFERSWKFHHTANPEAETLSFSYRQIHIKNCFQGFVSYLQNGTGSLISESLPVLPLGGWNDSFSLLSCYNDFFFYGIKVGEWAGQIPPSD